MPRHIMGMPILSMATLYLLGTNDQNEAKHELFSHGMPLVSELMSCHHQWHHFVYWIKTIETRCDTMLMAFSMAPCHSLYQYD